MLDIQLFACLVPPICQETEAVAAQDYDLTIPDFVALGVALGASNDQDDQSKSWPGPGPGPSICTKQPYNIPLSHPPLRQTCPSAMLT